MGKPRLTWAAIFSTGKKLRSCLHPLFLQFTDWTIMSYFWISPSYKTVHLPVCVFFVVVSLPNGSVYPINGISSLIYLYTHTPSLCISVKRAALPAMYSNGFSESTQWENPLPQNSVTSYCDWIRLKVFLTFYSLYRRRQGPGIGHAIFPECSIKQLPVLWSYVTQNRTNWHHHKLLLPSRQYICLIKV